VDGQKHVIPGLTDKVVEGAKKTKRLFFASLCALVLLCGMKLPFSFPAPGSLVALTSTSESNNFALEADVRP
jgi:hypothetical protein